MPAMERTKGMIVGFGFLGLALSLKSLYSGEHSTLINLILILALVLGPTMLVQRGKNLKVSK